MSLRDTIRGLVPGITDEHLERAVGEVRSAVERIVAQADVDLSANGGSGRAGLVTRPAHQAQGRDVPRTDAAWRLVERDGKPYPPAREPEPVSGVKPATNEQIAQWGHHEMPIGSAHHAIDALIARVRQEQAALLQTNGWLRDAERERDEAVARADAAEANLAHTERVTAAERSVVKAAATYINEGWPEWFLGDLIAAVDALRDAQAAGQ